MKRLKEIIKGLYVKSKRMFINEELSFMNRRLASRARYLTRSRICAVDYIKNLQKTPDTCKYYIDNEIERAISTCYDLYCFVYDSNDKDFEEDFKILFEDKLNKLRSFK